MSAKLSEVTTETVRTIIAETKATSLTQIAKHLGFKGSVSGSLSKRIRELVPEVADLLAQNKPAKDADAGGKSKVDKSAAKAKGKKTAAKPQASAPQDEGERLCPFRTRSKYAAIWLALWRHRRTGVTRKALTEEVASANKDFSDRRTMDFAVTVVASPTIEGGAHRSASKGADVYWVEKSDGGNLKLHLRDGKA